jgi:hypothetical protein
VERPATAQHTGASDYLTLLLPQLVAQPSPGTAVTLKFCRCPPRPPHSWRKGRSMSWLAQLATPPDDLHLSTAGDDVVSLVATTPRQKPG